MTQDPQPPTKYICAWCGAGADWHPADKAHAAAAADCLCDRCHDRRTGIPRPSADD